MSALSSMVDTGYGIKRSNTWKESAEKEYSVLEMEEVNKDNDDEGV